MKTLPPPSDNLLQHLSVYDLRVGELALALREIALDLAPDANEIVHKGYVLSITYSFTEKWTGGFCFIVLYSGYVNLGFNHGVDLEDPKGLLVGDGKQIRHIKIHQPEDLKKPHIRKFIRAAIRLTKADLAAKAAKRAAQSASKTSAKKRRTS